MSDDRGQALAFAVLALAIAAVAIVGLRGAQDRILADERERRAGEAAVEAAGAEVADALLAFLRTLDDLEPEHRLGAAGRPSRAELAAFIRDPRLSDRARSAADTLAAANGAAPVRELSIVGAGRAIEVSLALLAHRHRAAIETTCCRP